MVTSPTESAVVRQGFTGYILERSMNSRYNLEIRQCTAKGFQILQNAITTVSNFIVSLFKLVMDFIAYVDLKLSEVLPQAGISGPAATVVLVAVAILLALAALKFLGRAFAVLILILFGLLLLHALVPG